jgi:DNA anti-recombination protein RmuC
MQQVHASVASEVADIHAETSDLVNRIAKLNGSANHLEKEMDQRLVRVSSDIISGARTQLESALNVVLKDLGTRNSKELNAQLEDASNRLKIVQKGIETSVSDLVRAKVTDSLVSFGQTIEALAQDAVVRWRDGLASDLNSMTEILERKPQVKAAAND